MESLEVRLLGPPLIRWGQEVLTPGPKAASLLAYLAVEGRASRDRVMAFLWPDSTQKKAQGSLRYLLHSVRKMANELIYSDSQCLDLSTEAEVDLSILNNAQTPEERARAARLHRGLFCEGVPAPSPEFEDWLGKQREHWRTSVVENLLELAQSLERGEAIKTARQAVLLDPANEKAHATVIRYLMLAGDTSEAHRQMEACRDDLERELGVGPSESTLALLELETETHSNLPASRTELLGRSQSLGNLHQTLRSNRLLTLTGEGGIGKTTLALEACRTWEEARNTWFWELSKLQSGEDLDHELKRACCLPESLNLQAHLETAPTLLLIDNCEHIVEEVAPIVDSLLGKCPSLRILATSREPLRVMGEVVLPLDPLPCDETISPAVQLFLARAKQLGCDVPDNDIDAVVEICRRLDGLPLAIELAASRCRALTPGKLLEGLEQRFKILRNTSRSAEPRQTNLETLIAWSYDRLPEVEAEIMRQLCIFGSGFYLETASAVLELDEWELADTLQSLSEKSLLRSRPQGEGLRYYFLETIRTFGRKALAPEELKPLQVRHLEHFLSFAHNICPLTKGAQQKVWLDQLDSERSNFRQALRYALEHKPALALELAAALCPLWKDRDHREEGLAFLEKTLALCPESELEWPRAMLLKGELEIQLARCEDAVKSLEKSLALGLEREATTIVARAAKGLGSAHFFLKNMTESKTFYERALQGFQTVEDEHETANCINNMGMLSLFSQELEDARHFFEKSYEAQKRRGDCKGMGVAVGNLGYVATAEGDLVAAQSYFHEALRLLNKVGALWNSAYFLEGLGKAESAIGNFEHSARCLGVAESLRIRLSTPRLPFEQDDYQEFVQKLESELGKEFQIIWGEASKASPGDFVSDILRPGEI